MFMTLKGIYGHPRRLVTGATRRLCNAIKANTPEGPTKFVLMNMTGNRNRDLDEPISFAQYCMIDVMQLDGTIIQTLTLAANGQRITPEPL